MTNPAANNSLGGGVIGPFSVYQWKSDKANVDFNNATVVSFLIWEARTSGRNFIYYNGGIVRSKKAVSNATVLILYDKPD